MAFVLSVLALMLGPFVYALGQRQPTLRELFDGFVFITVAGIVCVHIIPQSITGGGAPALLFLAIGLAFPVLLERQFHHLMHRAHGAILVLAALGLVLHAMTDGLALLPMAGGPEPEAARGVLGRWVGSELAVGVILHRLPVGMAIWWSLRPHFGSRVAMAVFALVVAATALAYFRGPEVLALAQTRSLACFQAFVAGSLVHVVAFGVSHDHARHIERRPEGANWGYRVGILVGLLLLFTAPQLH